MTKRYRFAELMVVCLVGFGSFVATAQETEKATTEPPLGEPATSSTSEADPSTAKSATTSVENSNETNSPELQRESRGSESDENVLKIYTLKHADASECARLLNSLKFNSSSIVADKRTNCLVIETSDKKESRTIEGILQNLDKLPSSAPILTGKANENRPSSTVSGEPKEKNEAKANITLDPSNNPKLKSLIEELARVESKAEQLAQQIRNRRDEPGDNLVSLEQSRRQLDETLTRALAIKFKLEQFQVDALEERLTRLKAQIARRTGSVEQIVDRRARELIEGDASRWTPNEEESKKSPHAKTLKASNVAGVAPKGDLFEFREHSHPTPVHKSAKVESLRSEDSENDSIAALIQSRSYRKFADNLPHVNRNVREAVERLKSVEQELAQAKARNDVREIRSVESIMANLRANAEGAIRGRNSLQNEYAATMKDLVLQLEAAENEIRSVEINLEQRKSKRSMGGTITLQSIANVEKELRQAKLVYDRLKIRYELYKKAGEVVSDDGGTSTEIINRLGIGGEVGVPKDPEPFEKP